MSTFKRGTRVHFVTAADHGYAKITKVLETARGKFYQVKTEATERVLKLRAAALSLAL